MKEGDELEIYRRGRLYGEPAKWILKIQGGEPVCMPAEEWALVD